MSGKIRKCKKSRTLKKLSSFQLLVDSAMKELDAAENIANVHHPIPNEKFSRRNQLKAENDENEPNNRVYAISSFSFQILGFTLHETRNPKFVFVSNVK